MLTVYAHSSRNLRIDNYGKGGDEACLNKYESNQEGHYPGCEPGTPFCRFKPAILSIGIEQDGVSGLRGHSRSRRMREIPASLYHQWVLWLNILKRLGNSQLIVSWLVRILIWRPNFKLYLNFTSNRTKPLFSPPLQILLLTRLIDLIYPRLNTCSKGRILSL